MTKPLSGHSVCRSRIETHTCRIQVRELPLESNFSVWKQTRTAIAMHLYTTLRQGDNIRDDEMDGIFRTHI